MTTIAQLNDRHDLVLLTDSQDTDDLRRQFPGYASFFVKAENGDYVEVWGFCGTVPYPSKLTSRLIPPMEGK